MSIEATSWALGQTVGDPTRKLVLIAYANHAHKDGRHSWPSTVTVAEYAECDPRTVIRHRKVLVAGGWLREGDQTVVENIRADRRPIVYDVAMNEDTRLVWKHQQRPDSVSPRTDSTGGQAVTPSQGHGVTHGVTDPAPRGDTQVSPEQKEPTNTPIAPTAGCQRPGPRPHVNCRGCGTTNRQIAAAQHAQALDDRRAVHAAAAAADRAAKTDAAAPPAELLDKTRAAIADAKGGCR